MKKTAYIIGITQPAQGLIALSKHIMSHILYAKDNGYIPIVDCQHFANQYFKDNRVFQDNSWEYYFEQPAGYTLNDITKFDNVIISKNQEWADSKYILYPRFKGGITLSNFELTPYVKEYSKLFKFNSKMNMYFDEYYSKYKDETILGVLCRGTDYVKIHPKGHFKQATPAEVIAKAKEVLNNNPNISKIYLATEDYGVFVKFKKTFGDLLIESPQYRYDNNLTAALADINIERENHFYNLGKEYLLSLYILSKCKYYIGTINNGTLAVYLMSNLFENKDYVYIFNNGIYGKITYANFFEKIFSIKKDYTFPKTKKRDYSIKEITTCLTILGIKIKFVKKINVYKKDL